MLQDPTVTSPWSASHCGLESLLTVSFVIETTSEFDRCCAERNATARRTTGPMSIRPAVDWGWIGGIRLYIPF